MAGGARSCLTAGRKLHRRQIKAGHTSAKLHRNASIRPWTRSAVEQAHTGTNALAQMTNVDVILHSESRTLGPTLGLSVTIVVVPGLHILRIESHLRQSRHDIFLRVQDRGSCRKQQKNRTEEHTSE